MIWLTVGFEKNQTYLEHARNQISISPVLYVSSKYSTPKKTTICDQTCSLALLSAMVDVRRVQAPPYS